MQATLGRSPVIQAAGARLIILREGRSELRRVLLSWPLVNQQGPGKICGRFVIGFREHEAVFESNMRCRTMQAGPPAFGSPGMRGPMRVRRSDRASRRGRRFNLKRWVFQFEICRFSN